MNDKNLLTLAQIHKLQLANVCKSQKSYEEAIAILKEVIAENPAFAAAYNNLGTIYDVQMEWNKAISAYQAAIDIQPDYADAYYNLGLSQNKSGNMKAALATWQALLELNPSHTGAQFQLGRIYMRLQQYQKAIQLFHQIIENHPDHFETQSNLATSYLKLGWVRGARNHYLYALNSVPDDLQILFNLGVLAMQQGNNTEAIDYYRRIIDIDSSHFEAHNNLGVAFLAVKDREKALQHFRQAATIQPQNKALQHTIDILSRDKSLLSTPPAYIQSLFDSYADHYDAHITQALHYEVPIKMFEMVKRHIDLQNLNLNILDLGCGTGLCGELFRGDHHVLTGVDISANMLSAAREKNIYKELVQSEISDFLRDRSNQYDLILAGDVLVYMGDLEEILHLVHQALRQGGIFVFNAEPGETGFEMTPSGRFAHAKKYIDELIQKTNFRVLEYQSTPLRLQEEKPVQGHLYLLHKK